MDEKVYLSYNVWRTTLSFSATMVRSPAFQHPPPRNATWFNYLHRISITLYNHPYKNEPRLTPIVESTETSRSCLCNSEVSGLFSHIETKWSKLKSEILELEGIKMRSPSFWKYYASEIIFLATSQQRKTIQFIKIYIASYFKIILLWFAQWPGSPLLSERKSLD